MRKNFKKIIFVSASLLLLLGAFQSAQAIITHSTISKTLVNSGSGLRVVWSRGYESSLVNTYEEARVAIDKATGNPFVGVVSPTSIYHAWVKYNSSTAVQGPSVEGVNVSSTPMQSIFSLDVNKYAEPHLLYLDQYNSCLPGNCPFYRTYISKYLSGGSEDSTWRKTFSSATESIIGYELVVDSADNVIVLIRQASFPLRLIKFNRAGTPLYDRTFASGTIGYVHSAMHLALDNSNNVYVMGGSSTSSVSVIKKYGTDLNYVGPTIVDSNLDSPTMQYRDMTVGSSGAVYITGTNNGWTNFSTAKYNANGSFGWAQSSFDIGGAERATAIVVDESRNSVYAGGWAQFGSNSENFSDVIIRYNATTGAVQGYLHISPQSVSEIYPTLALDSVGNLYMASAYATNEIFKFTQGCTGPLSFPAWTDPSLAAGSPVRSAHITELRDRINTLRTDAGTSTYSWTDSSLAGISTKAQHINELRRAIEGVYSLCGQGTLSWTDGASVGAGGSLRAQHITELRSAVTSAR